MPKGSIISEKMPINAILSADPTRLIFFPAFDKFATKFLLWYFNTWMMALLKMMTRTEQTNGIVAVLKKKHFQAFYARTAIRKKMLTNGKLEGPTLILFGT